MENFVTNIEDLQLYKFREEVCGEYVIADMEVESHTCIVKWLVEFDMRNSGIRSIDVFAKDIECTFTYSFIEDELLPEEFDALLKLGCVVDGDKVIGEYKLDINDWKINTNFKIEDGGWCKPFEVELDFRNKEIDIN